MINSFCNFLISSIFLNSFLSKYPLLSFLVIDEEEFDDLYKDFSMLVPDFSIFKQAYKQESTTVKIIKTINVLFFFLKTYAIAFLTTILFRSSLITMIFFTKDILNWIYEMFMK